MDKLLSWARSRIFGSDEQDFSATIARKNLEIGVGRILGAMSELKIDGDVSFHLSPDFTITRSAERWGAGFAYGGLLTIVGERPLVCLDVRPNTCGTLTGRLHSSYKIENFVDDIAAARNRSGQTEWDYGRRNHFINLYQERSSGASIFVMHGCPAEGKADKPGAPGLYIERSPFWQKQAIRVETELGPLSVLLDDAALSYWENFRAREKESKENRIKTALEMFGIFETVANETHEGMISPQHYILGCHAAQTAGSPYPLMTAMGYPSFIVKAGSHVPTSPLPLKLKALLPHGLGYSLSLAGDARQIVTAKGEIITVLSNSVDADKQTLHFRNFANTPYSFRSPDVVDSWVAAGYFDVVDELEPRVFVKY